MFRKICTCCGLSSFSNIRYGSWTCTWCGEELMHETVKPIAPGEAVPVGPGGQYCALCGGELAEEQKDVLYCLSCKQRYLVRHPAK